MDILVQIRKIVLAITINVSSNRTHTLSHNVVLHTILLYDKVCQWLAAGQWFYPDTLIFSTNKTEI
jgi:hypothetical protein